MKPLVKLSDLSHTEWLEWRRGGIGGSDVAAILGASPYKGAYAVYLEKIGEKPADEGSEATEWGNRLEPYVAEAFADKSGCLVAKPQYIYTCDAYPWLRANLDYWVINGDQEVTKGRVLDDKIEIEVRPDSFLECKTAAHHMGRYWQDGPPLHYVIQCQTYLLVTGFDYCHIACLIGGQEFVYHRIEADPDFQERIVSATREFWRRVETREAPSPDGLKATTEAIEQRFPLAARPTVDISEAGPSALERYRAAQIVIKEAEAIKDTAANELRVLLGDSEAGMVDGDVLVEWREYKSRRLDTKAVRAALTKAGIDPATVEKESVSRRLVIKTLAQPALPEGESE